MMILQHRGLAAALSAFVDIRAAAVVALPHGAGHGGGGGCGAAE
jgi:hypothetical protein